MNSTQLHTLVAWSCEYPNICTGEKGVEGGWKWREGCIDAPEKATARLAWIATRRREGPRTCHQSCLGQRGFVTCFALVQSPYSSLRCAKTRMEAMLSARGRGASSTTTWPLQTFYTHRTGTRVSLFHSYFTIDLKATTFRIGGSREILNNRAPQGGSHTLWWRYIFEAVGNVEVGLPNRLFVLVGFS